MEMRSTIQYITKRYIRVTHLRYSSISFHICSRSKLFKRPWLFKRLRLGKMHTVWCRCVTMVVLCVLLAAFVSGQVTFSRDWSGGKRSPAAVFDCGQFARLCRHFLHELKQEMSDDKLIKHSRLEPEVQVNFEDDK